MEVGDGTVQRRPLQRIYSCLSSTLRLTRFPVYCRPEVTAFPGPGGRTTSCGRIACLIGNDVRVIELVDDVSRISQDYVRGYSQTSLRDSIAGRAAGRKAVAIPAGEQSYLL